jgi:copper chaperone
MSVNQIQVHVENIKCGGCEKSIVKGLMSIEGLSDVEIDREQQLVSVTADASLRDALVAKLKSMGYPSMAALAGWMQDWPMPSHLSVVRLAAFRNF